MENNYGKIFAEVLDIINNSEKEVKAKIPEKLYQQFEKNTDKSYKVKLKITYPYAMGFKEYSWTENEEK